MFSAMRFLFALLFATLMMVNAIQAKHFLVQTQDASQKIPAGAGSDEDFDFKEGNDDGEGNASGQDYQWRGPPGGGFFGNLG